MMTELNNEQLCNLMQHSQQLDQLAPALPNELQVKLLDIQKRAGATYASGMGGAPNAEPPTVEETKEALGNAYIMLDEQRKGLRELMASMDIAPEYMKKSWIRRVMDDVEGWFR